MSQRPLDLTSASISTTGGECFGVNDDRALVDRERSLFLVADGAGPTYGGYYAPIGMDVALDVVSATLGDPRGGADGESRLRAAFVAAHARCAALEEERAAAFEVERRRGKERLEASLAAGRTVAARCGRPIASFAHFAASITAIHVWDGDRITVAQVGVCRAYRLRQRRLEQLLPDHTLAGCIAASGETVDAEALEYFRLTPTKLLGMLSGSEVELRTERVEPGDRYVLCTDGVWGYAEPAALEDAIREGVAPAAVATALVDLVARRPSPSPHATAVVIDVGSGHHPG